MLGWLMIVEMVSCDTSALEASHACAVPSDCQDSPYPEKMPIPDLPRARRLPFLENAQHPPCQEREDYRSPHLSFLYNASGYTLPKSLFIFASIVLQRKHWYLPYPSVLVIANVSIKSNQITNWKKTNHTNAK